MKTLSDPDVSRVDVGKVVTTSIAALNMLPAHCGEERDRRVFAEEFQTFEILGRVTVARREADGDYHVALADPQTGETIIVEAVDPLCAHASTSPYLEALQQVRMQLVGSGSLVGQVVRVRGVGFFDFNHNQTGRSRSCIELHPILGIERVG